MYLSLIAGYHHIMTKTSLILLVLAVILVGFAGCLGEDSSSTTVTTTTPTTTVSTILNVRPVSTVALEVQPTGNGVKTTSTLSLSDDEPKKPTSTIPATRQKRCSSHSDCGPAPADRIICKSGDAYTYSQTPTCTDEGECRLVVPNPLPLLEECDDDERCVADVGCVARGSDE